MKFLVFFTLFGCVSFAFDKYVESTGNDGHSRFLDPHFVDAAAHDFHLQSDFPPLAAGTTDGVRVGELDVEGSPRVKSGEIDIGCYQTH